MTQRSIVYKSQLWSILEYHDARLRDLTYKQIEKISLKYEILRNDDLKAKDDKNIFIKIANRLPFGRYKLNNEESPLYFSFQFNEFSNLSLLKDLINSESLSFDSQDKLPLIKLSKEILISNPEILRKDRIYLSEKICSEEEDYFLPFGWGTIYQLTFQLHGLRNLWNEITPRSKAQKQFLDLREKLKNKKEQKEINDVIISLEDHIDKAFDWDKAQIQAFRKISAPNPFLVLNGFAGSGKTTVMNAGWKALRDFKILVLAHDHKTVNFLMQKYIDANPDVIFYRIGNNINAKGGEMGAYHIKSDNTRHRTQVLNRLDEIIDKLQKNIKKQKINSKEELERVKIIDEWRTFLTREEGMELFEKIKFNSARALFCTITGLEFYNKKGLLDCFLPFDFMFLDEASQIDIPLLFHASQFCKANIIAGDKNLVQPFKIDDDWKSKSMNVIDELERNYNEAIPELFVTFSKQYRMNPKIFSIIHEEMFSEMSRMTGSPMESLMKESELFSVRNQEPYMRNEPMNLIDTTNLGPKAKRVNKTNQIEVDIIEKTLEQLNNTSNWENPSFKKPIKIWITSLYSSQVDLMKETFEPLRESWNNLDINVSTIRSFTGDEADVVIWSITNAPLNYLKNLMNLKSIYPGMLMRADLIYDLITRSKGKLIMVGVKQVLVKTANKLQTRNQKNNKQFGRVLERIIKEGVTIAK